MKVINRDGELVSVSYEAIRSRLLDLCDEREKAELDIDVVTVQTIAGLKDGISTTELDELSATVCAGLQSRHYLYDALAGKILVSSLHKNVRRIVGTPTPSTFSEKIGYIVREAPQLVNDDFANFVAAHGPALDAIVDYRHDCASTYFSVRTMEKAYLMRVHGQVIETPQDMWMRVAVALYCSRGANDERSVDEVLRAIRETYEGMSCGLYTHATPTLFNAGTRHEQMSSCYLLGTDDSLAGIFKTLGDCAQISKWAGGLGVHVSNVRAKGSIIRSTGGHSDGIVPMLKVFNETAKYCNQSGRRKGSIAIYLEPWHADVLDFVELRRNTGAESMRARDLFLALWVPDLFMRKVLADEEWHLMTPDECPGLMDVFGSDFDELYERYVNEGRYVRKLPARTLWMGVLQSQIETGTPYVLFKDTVNARCNQSNVGVIRSSNLCVAPETSILTSLGYRPISSLKDATVDVWNGDVFSTVTVHQTGIDQPLLKVCFSNGETLECTAYHKFYVWDPLLGKAVVVEAKDLQPGMAIARHSMPVLGAADDKENFKADFKYPYTHGLFSGTGSTISGPPQLRIRGSRTALLQHLDVPCNPEQWTFLSDGWLLQLPRDMAAKHATPEDQVLEVKLRWLEGLVDGAGAVGAGGSLQISCGVPAGFPLRVKRLLNTMGADASVRGELIVLSGAAVRKLLALGFSPKHVDQLQQEQAEQEEAAYITIVSVVDEGRRDNTYCFNEPLAHAGVFNGIRAGNCAEVTQYSDHETYAVCNLASIAVNRFWDPQTRALDHARLHDVAMRVTRALDRVIDLNFYPTPETRRSNERMRPVGIGLQGLGDLYNVAGLDYGSPEALALDAALMETIYHGALTASVQLARDKGPYGAFDGSWFSKGMPQFMLGYGMYELRWDWDTLRAAMVQHGTRHSMLTALMPTASTSQILGNSEGTEPIQANVFKRSTLAGEFMVVNRHLMRDLMELGLWDEDMRTSLLRQDGSVADIARIPAPLRKRYRTVWELPQRSIIDHAAARAPFVDQSQSMNLYYGTPNYTKLHSALVHGWRSGLKTGLYYLRSRPAVEALKTATMMAAASTATADAPVCSLANKDECAACSA